MKKLLLTTALAAFATTAVANHGHDGVDYKAQVMELQAQIAEIQEYTTEAINEANAKAISLQAELETSQAKTVTYIAAWEEAKAKVLELLYEIAVLEQEVKDANNNQNAQIQKLAQYNADIKAELLATATRMLEAESSLEEANAELEHTRQNTQHMFDVTAAIANHNSNDAKAFTQDPAGLIDRFYIFTIDRLDDLKRAEGRIRALEKELEFHKSGGHWNPTNW